MNPLVPLFEDALVHDPDHETVASSVNSHSSSNVAAFSIVSAFPRAALDKVVVVCDADHQLISSSNSKDHVRAAVSSSTVTTLDRIKTISSNAPTQKSTWHHSKLRSDAPTRVHVKSAALTKFVVSLATMSIRVSIDRLPVAS